MTTPRLLWPEAHDLAAAPEIGVVALLDAACAAAVAHLLAANREIASVDHAVRGELPSPAARSAATAVASIHSLRAALRGYCEAALHADEPDIDRLF